MLNNAVEKRLAAFLSWGSLAITLLVTDRVNMDPANLGKMVLLSTIAGGVFALTVSKYKKFYLSHKLLTLSILGFLLFSLISIFATSSPWEKGFYGTYARNTGLLTYLSLSIILVAATKLNDVKSFKLIIRALLLGGLINLIYCLYTLTGHDIFRWLNPYKKILGTFGNPNFISSFLGIFVAALSALIASSAISRMRKTFILLVLILSIFSIVQSSSLQGLVVSASGIALVLFFYIRSKFTSSWFLGIYSLIAISGGIFSLLGVFQRGPLSNILYKSSISYRGEYWRAGINMGLEKPYTGVGLDSYGVFYRAYREASAAVRPGVLVVTDAAHNVFIDIFAGVGVIGFSFYMVIVGLVIRSAIKLFRKRREYDPIFVILVVSWICYQLQSIISINQIGLAIWGWLLGGAIIGYESLVSCTDQAQKHSQQVTSLKGKKTTDTKSNPISASMALSLFVGTLVGLFIALPPFIADTKSRPTNSGRTSEQTIAIAQMWPPDNTRMNRIIVNLYSSKLYEEAQSLAVEAALKFPDDYVAWFTLNQITPEGTSEKKAFIKHLHELDPYNPEFAPK
jgi:O-antigen ligase